MDDQETGKILREIVLLRGDVQSLREHGDARHRTVANELAELRAMATRAVDTAADAKRVADNSAHEMRGTQKAIVDHTKGLVQRQEAIEVENNKQTASLALLLAAETERKIREDERKQQDDTRWKWIARAGYIGGPLVAVVSWLVAHWKP